MTPQQATQAIAPLRIALIAPLVAPIAEPQVGGSQVVVSDLARGLVMRGHDVTLYAAEGSHVEGVTVASLGIDAGAFSADAYRHASPALASQAMAESYRTLYAHIRGRGFDIVHNHGYDAPAIAEGVVAQVSVVHTIHLPPTGAITGAINDARGSSVATWFFGVSAGHTAAWQRSVRMDGTLANGVPVESIPFSRVAPREAVIASRFSPEKGMAESITAARLAGWPVVVHGVPYDPEYEASVRARWSDDPGVRFLPALQRKLLWTELGGAAALLALVRWEEPFGMVAAEAQAAGTPVVATRQGNLPEIVVDGETGALVDLDDVEGAATALERVGKLDRGACRRHAVEHLSLAHAIARHEDVYARVVARARATA